MLTGRGALGAMTVLEVLLVAWVILGLMRAVRVGRASGRDGWAALEDALARAMPRRLARLLLIEPRLLASLIAWMSRRHHMTGARSFSYHRGARMLLGVTIGLVVVEGVVVDALVAALVPSGPWWWLAFGVHGYALVWLVAFYASLVMHPHELRAEGLHVRDGVFTGIVVPYDAITGVRVRRRPNFGRSGLKHCVADGTALLAMGDATVTLQLDPTKTVAIASGPLTGLTDLAITVDDVSGFREQLGQRVASPMPGGSHGSRLA